MGRTFNSEVIVVRTLRYREADSLVTFVSPQHGRIGAIAKGARKTSSRRGGRLQPITRLNAQFHPGRTLATVTQVESIDVYRGIKGSLLKVVTAEAGCELAMLLMQEEQPAPDTYQTLVDFLGGLDQGLDEESLGRLVAAELALLADAGFRPTLEHCAGCRTSTLLETFSYGRGGLLCASCSEHEAGAFRIQPPLSMRIRDLARGDGLTTPTRHDEAASAIVDGFITFHIGSSLRSYPIVKHLFTVQGG